MAIELLMEEAGIKYDIIFQPQRKEALWNLKRFRLED